MGKFTVVDHPKSAEYNKLASAVLDAMPERAHQLMAANLAKVNYHSNIGEITAIARRLVPLSPSAKVFGFYISGDRSLTLDGGEGGDNTKIGVYAHEMTHAVDGPGYRISGGNPGRPETHDPSNPWQTAFRKELDNGQLTKYAATKPTEGFAEFGRALYAGQVPKARLEREFPLCSKHFKEHGLWL